jgi:hypothetical protein
MDPHEITEQPQDFRRHDADLPQELAGGRS